jgi:iron complex transport system ATP-binding protein
VNAPALQCDGLVLELGGRRVVDGVTLAFEPGCWTAIVGPNGAGKSSLLSLLAGLRRPAAGVLRLLGRPLADWPARERACALAWLSQHGEADGDIAAIDVVRLGRLPHTGLLGAPDADDEAAVREALRETEIEVLAARRLNELSGGERQRVLIARALAARARVLLLDEPTTHLDAPHQRTFIEGLLRRARAGATVVSVLHDLTLALAADRVVVMAGGRVLADGAPGERALRERLAEAFGHAFTIEAVGGGARPRYVALPRLDPGAGDTDAGEGAAEADAQASSAGSPVTAPVAREAA